MKYSDPSKLLAYIAIGGSLLISGTSYADFHVTAFAESTGYNALLNKDIERAKSGFTGRELELLDFSDANNLCVTQILSSELESAITSCNVALSKVDSALDLSASAEKAAKASIISNMAVAKAMGGDVSGAQEDLEKALFLNGRDANASSNYTLLRTRSQLAEVAQGI